MAASDQSELLFDSIQIVAFNMRVVEIGDCYADNRALLHLELRKSRVGAWEVEIVDRDQQRRITNQYDDEMAARRGAQVAYAYGRQFGRWLVQRADDYQPVGTDVICVGWEPSPAQDDSPATV